MKTTKLTTKLLVTILLASMLPCAIAYKYHYLWTTDTTQISTGLTIKPFPIVIEGIATTPLTPGYEDEVVVTTTITGEITEASLYYTYDSAWHNVPMSRSGDTFNATIPLQPYGTLVQYRVCASDVHGYSKESALQSYTVGDFVAPAVDLSHVPIYPLPGQKVKVYADVIEPVNASGMKSPVFFSYRANGGPWWNTTMIYNATLGLYETTIFGYEKHDFVEYSVKAVDNAGNINATAMHHYEVLRCDVNHNGVVDVYDVYLIAEAWESRLGEAAYNAEADINEDGIIDNQDLTTVNMQYGKDP